MENPELYGLTVLSSTDPASDLSLAVYGRAEAGQRLVNARELHATLGIGKDYTTWVKERIGKHRFTHNTDYVMLQPDKPLFPKVGEQKEFSPKLGKTSGGKNLGGRPKTEYAFSLDAAKMVAMGTNNEVGDKIKRYFLYCEKLALGATPAYALAPELTIDQMLPGLEQHLNPRFQRQQVQQLYGLLRANGGANAVIRYGADTCRSQTGVGARDIIALGQAVGLPAKHRQNAREVLRHLAPAVACSMSLLDTLAVFGAPRETAGNVAAQAQEVFASIINIGLHPSELLPGQRFLDGGPNYQQYAQ